LNEEEKKFDNPYFEFFVAAVRKCEEELNKQEGRDRSIVNFYLPTHTSFRQREEGVKNYGYTIYTKENVREIAQHGPFIEIGAGTGYLAYLLEQMGTDVKCFDDYSWSTMTNIGAWHKVEKGSYEKIADYSDRTLLLSWPPYSESFGYDVLTMFKNCDGRKMVYIGEMDGCCGDDNFAHELEKWKVSRIKSHVNNWGGIYDDIYIAYRRGHGINACN